MTSYFKVTDKAGNSVHGGKFAWPLPDGDTPGAWTPAIENPVICQQGYHLTTEPGRWIKTLDCRVFTAENAGIAATADDKIVTTSARLVREVELPYLVAVRAFVASIADIPFGKPDGNPDPAWRLFPSRAAAGAAAWSAAGDAARDAARSAARSAAGDAARSAAGDAAWSAAWSAAGDAARSAAWAAARSAALEARMVLIDDLGTVPPHHRQHSRDRWSVYQKGYWLYGDVGGVLYVYEVAR
jgi:hypothetical protein